MLDISTTCVFVRGLEGLKKWLGNGYFGNVYFWDSRATPN